MSQARRTARIDEVLASRLHHVRIAIEHVHHRHNTSAMLRTADALGVQHVHLIGSPTLRIVRGASRGASRWLSLHEHDTAQDALSVLKTAGFDVYVCDLATSAYAPEHVPLDCPLCLWFGAEVLGVSSEALESSTGVVRLPMYGFAQSLNVSVAAALITHTVCERARSELGDAARLAEPERSALASLWHTREHDEDAAIVAQFKRWTER